MVTNESIEKRFVINNIPKHFYLHLLHWTYSVGFCSTPLPQDNCFDYLQTYTSFSTATSPFFPPVEKKDWL